MSKLIKFFFILLTMMFVSANLQAQEIALKKTDIRKVRKIINKFIHPSCEKKQKNWELALTRLVYAVNCCDEDSVAFWDAVATRAAISLASCQSNFESEIILAGYLEQIRLIKTLEPVEPINCRSKFKKCKKLNSSEENQNE